MFKLFVVVLWMFTSGTLTWSSNINSIFTARSIVPSKNGTNAKLIEGVANGAQIAMNQCQEVFKWTRWNCPETSFSRRSKHPANRELAYVRAIIAAGIVHTITRNCSRGEIDGCGCSPHIQKDTNIGKSPVLTKKDEAVDVNWTWGGCSDHVDFGDHVAKSFLDDLETGNDVQMSIHLHNNNVGREIVKQTMIKRCRCHGVSGSCTVQTCWMQVASFRSIAEKLKDRYHKAVRIEKDEETNLPMESMSPKEFPNVSSGTLLYLEESPDYCKADNITNWTGTKGRNCSRSKPENLAEKKSCRNLCRGCGLRVKKLKKTIKVRCNCSFKWCCEVKCDTCNENVEEHYCD